MLFQKKAGDIMIFNGWIKNSFIDYPGKIATTLFVSRCNMRCSFCHNALLVREEALDSFQDDEVILFLEKRIGLLEAVCISGGEPSLYPELFDFIKKVKNLGFLVKVDTNGLNPKFIKELIKEGLVDYIAMDVKNSFIKYPLTVGLNDVNIENIKESISILLSSSIEYEFRTTISKSQHSIEDVLIILNQISGADNYYLQRYVTPENKLSNENIEEFSKEEYQIFYSEIKKSNLVKNIQKRG